MVLWDMFPRENLTEDDDEVMAKTLAVKTKSKRAPTQSQLVVYQTLRKTWNFIASTDLCPFS